MQQSIPQLPYLDKEETIDFYRNVLGFEVSDDWDGYIITRKDKIEIHLWQCKDENLPKNTGCYIRYGRNIEDLYLKYSKAAIIHEHGKLELKPWGMKQFSILDNSGNIIHVGQNT
jgi:catechol 2,3-dioxygenase-like lactoylglutathione lyase family enzyme